MLPYLTLPTQKHWNKGTKVLKEATKTSDKVAKTWNKWTKRLKEKVTNTLGEKSFKNIGEKLH